jgi:hypothetical protein
MVIVHKTLHTTVETIKSPRHKHHEHEHDEFRGECHRERLPGQELLGVELALPRGLGFGAMLNAPVEF